LVTATDGATTVYAYDDLTTVITDTNGHATESTQDSWGRTVLVEPPAGPSVFYTYDAADRLTQVVRGGSTTTPPTG